ncbi:SGNH/GDSL hydrolase family protein [Dyadobacter sp. 22481]|uniref:SGNH/GDSL hydrolase family protein n=1 Tax=Dyadobacter sp. 22481 TaxID=3453926 RepID=UPI003F8642CD
MNTFRFALLFFLTVWVGAFGQTTDSYIPKVVPPSPQAASLTRYVDIPVSYYTGTANISIPIYAVQDGKASLPISISYHPSGIKVADEASQVGLGWALNAGGVISRTIMGEDDFTLSRYFSTNNNLPTNYFPKSYLQAGTAVSGDQSKFSFDFYSQQSGPGPLSLKVEDGTDNEYEPDVYNFNFAGYSGKFIISRTKEIIMNEKSDIRIKMLEANNGADISWEIKTPDGTTYLFNQKETFKYASGGTSVSSWYLSQVTSTDGATINLSYNTIANAFNYPQGAITETLGVMVLGETCSSGEGQAPIQPHTIERIPPKYISTVYLNEITFQNGSVKFIFENREDLSYDKRLKTVEVYNKPGGVKTILKTYDFNYAYFNGTADVDVPATSDGSGSVSKRLKLLSLTEKSTDGSALKPHVFEYFESATGSYDLPAKTSFAQDHWGYYNGKQGNTSLIPTHVPIGQSSDDLRYYFGQLTGTQRDTDPNYLKAFSLKKITYPTGGYSEFNYEAHEYDVNNSNKSDYSFAGNLGGTLAEKNVLRLYNMNQKGVVQDFEVDFSKAATGPDKLTTNLRLNGYVRLSNLTSCNTLSGQSGKVYFELIEKSTGLSIGTYDMFTMQECTDNTNGLPSPCISKGCGQNGMTMGVGHTNTIYNIMPGKYILRTKASDGTGFEVADFSFHFYWYEPLEATEGSMKNAGGLRLKTITANDGVQSNVRTFSYRVAEIVNGQTIEKSTGRLMTKPQYTYAEQRWCKQSLGGAAYQYKDYFAIFRTSNSIIPLNTSAGGSVVGYDRVVVSYGGSGESGQSIFYYENQSDVVNNFLYFRPPAISSKPFKSNGNLLRQEDFVKSGSGFVKVKETEYEYSFSTPTYQYAAELRTVPTFIGGAIGYEKRHGFFYPAMIKNWNYLKSEKTKIYDLKTPGTLVETTKEYFYNNTNYTQLSQTKATDSRGRKIVTSYKYPFDYSSQVYLDMVTKNMVNPVIEETTGIENGAAISWINTEYFNSSGSIYVPKKVDKKIGSGPIVNRAEFLSYDTRGNLLTYKENGGATTKLEYYGTTDVGKTDLLKSRTEADGTTVSAKTTYDYKSLVGVESITDPAGKVTWYNYDKFSRLSDIRENNSTGNLIKSFHYNLANQGGWENGIVDDPAVVAPSTPDLVSGGGTNQCTANLVKLLWRDANHGRLVGATIQGSANGMDWEVLYQFPSSAPVGTWLTANFNNPNNYPHIRYNARATDGVGDLKEIRFYYAANGTETALSGTGFGSEPNLANQGWANAIDGNETTQWHAEYVLPVGHPGNSNFVGISLPCATTLITPTLHKSTNGDVCANGAPITLTASGFSGQLEWYLNDVLISGTQPGQTQYVATIAGVYKVRSKSGSSYSSFSNTIVLNQTSGCTPPNYSRVVIVGNSITKLIAQSGTDGWQSPALSAAGGWGRASSTQAKDFAHILETRFKQLDPNAQVLPLWEAPFERDYISSPAGWVTYNFTALQNRIANSFGSSSWKPDLVIIRLGENVLNSEVELNNFKGGYNTLINKILEVSAPGAKVIVTNSMWPDQPLADQKIQQVANERGLPFISLSDMISNPVYLAGNDPVSMAAFPNNTGDRHPGDAGMLEIADRIWSKVRNVELPSNIGGNITKVRLYPRTDACCISRITGSVIQGSNDTSNANGWTTLATISQTPVAGWNEYAIRTTTAWRYLRFLAGPNCHGELKELEFYNGNVKLSGLKFGSSAAFTNDPAKYGYSLVFDGQLTNFWHGTAAGPQNYAGLDLGAGCPSLTASVLSPANNASVVGTASTTTTGRVTTAISVTTCVPTGTTITSVEIWAATGTGGFPNRMGYAIADASQPGVYKLSAEEGSANGKWPVAYLDPDTYRFYAKINTASATLTTDYITVTLTAPAVTSNITKVRLSPRTECCMDRIVGSVIQGSNDISNANGWTTLATISQTPAAGWNEYAIQTTTNWRYVRFLAGANCYGELKELEFYNGNVKLTGTKFGSPSAYNNDPANYGYSIAFDGLVTNSWHGTAPGPQNYAGLDLGTGCPSLTASMLSPSNNASVVGTASTTTIGRVITPINVSTCVPAGTAITSVEIWASTISDTFHNLMGKAIADASQPGVYKLLAEEGSVDGKWTAALLDPGTYRFYAKVKTAATTFTTNYITVTLTAPAATSNITKVRFYPRTDCCIDRITGSVIQGSNDMSNANGWTTLATINQTPIAGWNEYSVQTSTAWRYLRFLAGPNCHGELKELEFYNGNVKLSGLKFGSSAAFTNDPAKYGYSLVFDGQLTNFWHGTAAGPQNYAGLDLGAGCPSLTASVLSPANNASVVGTASTTTPGRVITAISVSTCAPAGTAITSVEIWASTTSDAFHNLMGKAIADASQPGVYKLSAQEGSADGKWPSALLDPGTYRFYAVVKTATATVITNYITVTLTAPPVTGCPTLTGSVISPANNASVVGTASTVTAGRVITAISVNTCAPAGSTITSVEIWASTTSDTFHNLMGYAIADASQPGVYKLSAQEGSANGKWPTALLDPGTYRFYAKVKTATTTFTTNYNTITLTAPPVTGCPALTGSVISPANNASVVGTPSTVTAGRVITAISVNTCAPAGSTITSVEIWASTTSDTFHNLMGYAIADASQPGVYTLFAQEGSVNGKWPTALLDPGTYRFYAKVKTATTTFTTSYNTITLTAPPITGCPALTGSVISPANNASVVGTASTTTAGRVITAISVTTCAPTGSAITSVEIRAQTSTGGFDTRMGYAVADASLPGVYKLSAQEGTANGKWITPPPLAPGTYRFYAVVKTAAATYTTDYITVTLTAP